MLKKAGLISHGRVLSLSQKPPSLLKKARKPLQMALICNNLSMNDEFIAR